MNVCLPWNIDCMDHRASFDGKNLARRATEKQAQLEHGSFLNVPSQNPSHDSTSHRHEQYGHRVIHVTMEPSWLNLCWYFFCY